MPEPHKAFRYRIYRRQERPKPPEDDECHGKAECEREIPYPMVRRRARYERAQKYREHEGPRHLGIHRLSIPPHKFALG